MRGIDPVRLERELERLARRWRQFWPEADAAAMAVDVGERAWGAAEVWGVEDLELLAGGRVALVAGGTRAGQGVVLKVRPRGHGEELEMAGERAALAAWEASGAAVPLIDTRDADLTLLLERLRPGTSLEGSALDGEERLLILGEVAARLHAASPGDLSGLVSLADWSVEWRRNLAGRPRELTELDDLLTGTSEETILHNDLHGENVLLHQGRWLAIDPNAAQGDRSGEIWPLINPSSAVLDADPGTMRALVSAYVSAADLGPERARRWARIRALAEAEFIDQGEGYDGEDRAWAAKLRRFAAVLDGG